MNTIAIFSDIHGNYQALSAILNDIKSKNIDKVFFLGDAVGIGPNPRECLDAIISNHVQLVLGNHELYALKSVHYIDGNENTPKELHEDWTRSQLSAEQIAFLKAQPFQLNLQLGNSSIALQHFLFNPDKADHYPFDSFDIIEDGSVNTIAEQLDADITFIGHMHSPFSVTTAHKTVIDVGSSGCTKDNQTFYTIASVDNGHINIEKVHLSYDRPAFEKAIRGTDYPERSYVAKEFFDIKIKP